MIFEFPPLKGEYGVGTTTRYLIDAARQEPHNPSANRELMIHLWYPANADKHSLELYCKDEIEINKIAFLKKGYPEKNINELDSIYTHAVPNAEPLKKDVPFPVVLFSHGYLGTKPVEYTAFCEELASHGYIVVGIAHTYFASSVLFPDGRQITTPREKYMQQNKPDFEKDQELWIADAQFVIDQLTKINANSKDQFFNLFDLDKIGMFGHSFGGLVSLYMLLSDNRIKAGINFDQMSYLASNKIAITKPFMFLMAQQTIDCINALNKSDEQLAQVFECDIEIIRAQMREAQSDWINMEKNYQQLIASNKVPYAIIPNIKHGGFSDYLVLKELPLYKNNKQLINLEAVTGTANGFETMEKINQHIVGFFDKYLKGVDQ